MNTSTTTVEELESMPHGTILRTRAGNAIVCFQDYPDRVWYMTGESQGFLSEDIIALCCELTIIYLP